ncbi:MAG: HAMP domain-containing protein [Sinobacteraceae bacterium]|nr:HAMP domain-containing protein [Nevskiaceae bacterium]MBV9317087.1 HAMP domain-containing protein [Gammaproteobacteria bacterium]
MHSLYWRIFLAFWAALALILVGTVTVAVNATAHRSERPWVQRSQLYAQAARAFESGGAAALERWLQALPADPFGRTFIIGPDGREMLERPLPPLLSASTHTELAAASTGSDPGGGIAPIGGALVLVAPGGATYHVVVGPVRDSPRLFGELELPGVPLAILAIALAASAGVCYLLARYLAAPVDRLRLATRRMAAGDLEVRVVPALRGRQDDLGLLAADLDAMAQRLQQLLEAKQQLLRDVSHELRSPLTRLQLALSLARREHSGSDRYLARIGCEADRLELLIARTLKLVRLERPANAPIEQRVVDVGELLHNIAADVAIEADVRGCLVNVQAPQGLAVCGDPELLRSAFENVIRNAVRFSPAGAVVVVSARKVERADSARTLEVAVHDSGPGVPEKELALIFEPFYRVDAARAHRGTAGEGLGLAIAARALAVHGGAISAHNMPGGGLAVVVSLPFCSEADGESAAAPGVPEHLTAEPSR